VVHHPAGEPEFKDAFPKIVRGFSILPTEIRHRHFEVEIVQMGNPGRGADNQRPFTEKEPLENLRSIQALPARTWLLASKVKIGRTHTERRTGGQALRSLWQKIAGMAQKRMQDCA
jgi:hypothetical protein